MQTVELNVFGVWHAVVVPASHDVKTAEQADAKLSSDTRHNTLVFLLIRQGDYSRYVLKTHQHEVGAQRFTDSNSFTQSPFEDVKWHVVHRGVVPVCQIISEGRRGIMSARIRAAICSTS